MKQNLYSVFDRKTGIYSPPMAFPAVGAAVRMFTDEVNGGQSLIGKHPEDYDLYHVGEFDDNTAQLEPLVSASLVVAGLSVKQ